MILQFGIPLELAREMKSEGYEVVLEPGYGSLTIESDDIGEKELADLSMSEDDLQELLDAQPRDLAAELEAIDGRLKRLEEKIE